MGVHSTTKRATHRPRIVVLLLALVLVPSIALAFGIKQNFDQNSLEQASAERTIELSERRLDAIRVEAALANERNWASVNLGVDSFGVDNEFITELLGLDIKATFAATQTAVDDLLAVTNFDIAELVTEARTTHTDVIALSDAYKVPMAQVRLQGEAAATSLVLQASTSPNAENVTQRLTYLDRAADLTRALSDEHVHLFSSKYFLNDAGPLEQLEALISDRRDFVVAAIELENTSGFDPALAAELESLLNAEPIVELQAAVESHIEVSLQNGLVTPEADVFAAALIDIDESAALFKWSIAAIEDAVNFTGNAGQPLLNASNETLIEINERTRAQSDLAVVVAALTLLMLFLVARIITNSVRSLASAAEAIHNGEEVDFKPSGPAEIHRAGQIVSNLGDSVMLVTAQSLALANGSLNDPALRQPARGPLGKSLNKAVGTLTASIREREQFRARLAHEADHDGLTGIANRTASTRHLTEALARSERSGEPLAVLYIDLDGFKPVNDLHGHRAGDEVLTTVANRLATAARTGDYVGRLGGDEFILIAEAIGGNADAMGLAHRVRVGIGEPITTIGGTTVTVGASIGVTMAPSGATPEAVIHDADLALYAAKQSGRNTVSLCTDSMRAEASQNIDLATAIENGLTDGEFTLHYQPVVSRDGKVESLEALIRWEHPNGTMAAPDSFIPFAEQSDLIVKLDCWVLHRVVRQLADWTDHPVFGDLSIAVNVSGRHLGHRDFVEHIKAPLDDMAVDPERLIVEITETALLHDSYDSVRKLNATRALGVRIAIDDFGTGYTGLTHLRTLPIDIIKIDSEFIARVDDADSQEAILVRLIVETGHLLGAEITAEGVELPDQVAALDALGSDKLQGYLFSQPVPPDELEKVLGALDKPPRPLRAVH